MEPPASAQIAVELPRLLRELEQLASFSDAPPPAVTRVVFSDTDRRARAYLSDLYEEAGLAVRVDPVGNVFARWEGSDPSLPPVATGSHVDAIPYAGRYDGTVGVLGALEALRALRRAGLEPRRAIEIVQFTAEEPTRFGVGCLGSRLLSGALEPELARDLCDGSGDPLEEVRAAAGFSGALEDVPLAAGAYRAFLELHIEQGRELERHRTPIGVVRSIAAPASLRVRYLGPGGHAGGVLMHERADALAAAAELVLAIESAATKIGAEDTVATAGTLDVLPGAINSIPSQVTLGIDLRDVDHQRRDRVLRAVERSAREIGARRLVSVEIDSLNADAPAHCDQRLREQLIATCNALGYAHRVLVSRAYHDALFMARIAPMAMVFVPCRDGVSHRPEEHVEPEDLKAGLEVLASTLARLAMEGADNGSAKSEGART